MLEKHFRALEAMYHAAPINEFFLPVAQIGEGRAIIEIEVRPTLFHAAGAAHGSVYFKCLDDAAFFAVNSIVPDVFVLTTSFTVYLMRPVTEGTLVATGTLVSRSKNLFVADSELRNNGKLVGKGSGTFMRSAIELTPEVGYK